MCMCFHVNLLFLFRGTVAKMSLSEKITFWASEFLLRKLLWVPGIGYILQTLIINPFLMWQFNRTVAYLEKELGYKLYHSH